MATGSSSAPSTLQVGSGSQQEWGHHWHTGHPVPRQKYLRQARASVPAALQDPLGRFVLQLSKTTGWLVGCFFFFFFPFIIFSAR